jgi:hypothetical protein
MRRSFFTMDPASARKQCSRDDTARRRAPVSIKTLAGTPRDIKKPLLAVLQKGFPDAGYKVSFPHQLFKQGIIKLPACTAGIARHATGQWIVSLGCRDSNISSTSSIILSARPRLTRMGAFWRIATAMASLGRESIAASLPS